VILQRGFTPEEAALVATWVYEPPFDLYDSADADAFLQPDYRPVYDGDELVGFVCFGDEARVVGQVAQQGTLDVGAGLRPDRLSRGIGTSLLPEVVAHARARPGVRRLRAAVAAFNERSQQLCLSAGFRQVRRFPGPQGREFVELVLDLTP
jgi:RimJ/RimL family protein N-acetyltransferase